MSVCICVGMHVISLHDMLPNAEVFFLLCVCASSPICYVTLHPHPSPPPTAPSSPCQPPTPPLSPPRSLGASWADRTAVVCATSGEMTHRDSCHPYTTFELCKFQKQEVCIVFWLLRNLLLLCDSSGLKELCGYVEQFFSISIPLVSWDPPVQLHWNGAVDRQPLSPSSGIVSVRVSPR